MEAEQSQNSHLREKGSLRWRRRRREARTLSRDRSRRGDSRRTKRDWVRREVSGGKKRERLARIRRNVVPAWDQLNQL